MQPSLLTRLRWRLEELRHVDDAKVIGGLLLIAALTVGGFFAARTVVGPSAGSPSATRMVTVRHEVRVREHGHVLTRWHVRRLYAQAQTLMCTQKISTPHGVRLVTRPVTRYRVVYRSHLVTVPAKTVTVTRRVTAVETTTGVATKTVTLPVTITVTLP